MVNQVQVELINSYPHRMRVPWSWLERERLTTSTASSLIALAHARGAGGGARAHGTWWAWQCATTILADPYQNPLRRPGSKRGCGYALACFYFSMENATSKAGCSN
jgi:hypothetical protein